MYEIKNHDIVLSALNVTFSAEDIRHGSGELSTAGLRPGVRSSFFFSGNGSSFLVEVVGPGDFPQAFKS